MCGIAGIAGPGAADERGVLARMASKIAHRGPDDEGSWHEAEVALAHRRLAIIDLTSAGHQPMLSDCGRYAIVFNGEIYNYLELRSDLESRGDRFRGHSDTEVLLAAFKRWGREALPRLNGMWAFAIWDRKEGALFASRDRFGKKPFYYAQLHGRFYFASEIKSLLAVPGMSARINGSAVADFCVERISDHTEATFFEGVSQMPPATYLWWRDGVTRIERYWRLEPAKYSDEATASADEIAALVNDAVKLRLRADTPVGCLLSGGLDSSSVASLMARQAVSDQPLHAFTTYNDPPVPESAGVRQVLDLYPRFHEHSDTPTSARFWNDLPGVIWHQEEPFADASMVAHFGLMREARKAGVPVLLTGQGADEVFGGYESSMYAYLGSRFRQGRFAEGAHAVAARRALGDLPVANVIFHAMPLALSRLGKRAILQKDLDWLSADFAKPSSHIEAVSTRGVDPMNDYLRQCLEVRTLPGFLHYEDRNSMAFGVETRLPFLDYRLVERVFRVPASQRYAGARTKALLRDAMERIVPAPIVGRVLKQGYPAPLGRWLRELEPQIRELVGDAASRSNPILVWSRWLPRLERFISGDDSQLSAAWRGIALLLWHRRFIEAEPAVPCA